MSAADLPSGAAGIGFLFPDYHALSDSQRLAADFIAHYVMEYEVHGVEGEPAKRVFRLKQAIQELGHDRVARCIKHVEYSKQLITPVTPSVYAVSAMSA